MVAPILRDRIQIYAARWAWRFVINLLKFSLLSTLLGTFMFALIMAQLFMVTGDGPVPAIAGVVLLGTKAFNYILASVTGGGDFEGGVQEIGNLIMAFLGPYLTAISLVVSLAESLTGRSLFRWMAWPLKSRLRCLWAGFGLLIGLSVFASNVSPTELPYWLRALLLAFMGGWAALLLLLLHWISTSAEKAFGLFCDRQTP